MKWLFSQSYLKYWPLQWLHLTLVPFPLRRSCKWSEVITVGPKKIATAIWDEMPQRRLWNWTLTSITVSKYCWCCSVNGIQWISPGRTIQLSAHSFIFCLWFLDGPHSLNYFLSGSLLRQLANHSLDSLARPHFSGSMMSADEPLDESWQIAAMTCILENVIAFFSSVIFFLRMSSKLWSDLHKSHEDSSFACYPLPFAKCSPCWLTTMRLINFPSLTIDMDLVFVLIAYECPYLNEWQPLCLQPWDLRCLIN